MQQIVSLALRSSRAHEQLDGIRAEAWAKCRRYQLFWGQDVTQGFGGAEAGPDPEGGAGGGQVEADPSADFKPRPYGTQAHSSSSGLGQARQCGQLDGAGVSGGGARAVPGKLAEMDLQGSRPHLTQWGDAEGQGSEGGPPADRRRVLALSQAASRTPGPQACPWHHATPRLHDLGRPPPPGPHAGQPEQRPTHDCPPQEQGPRCQRAAGRSGRPQGWV